MPELHWLGDDEAKRAAKKVPYRLLDPIEAVGDPAASNWLIQGDNLDALKALLPFYAGRVKCIFIDPPYNTRSAFEHYDDNLEHSQWLSMMYPRLELLRDLLAEDGSIWVTIDDNEGHYLKVMMDEVFGRRNFVANAIWQKKFAGKADSEFFTELSEHYRFRFDPGIYPARWLFSGRYDFHRHFYPLPGELRPEIEREETACAIQLDEMDAVRFWVRNLERQPESSFWLPTSTDRFYPDFVAEHMDGRILVVEYKGGHLIDAADAREKSDIGKVWAAASGGRCLFAMVTDAEKVGSSVAAQLKAALKC